jgi:hypothetical protein
MTKPDHGLAAARAALAAFEPRRQAAADALRRVIDAAPVKAAAAERDAADAVNATNARAAALTARVHAYNRRAAGPRIEARRGEFVAEGEALRAEGEALNAERSAILSRRQTALAEIGAELDAATAEFKRTRDVLDAEEQPFRADEAEALSRIRTDEYLAARRYSAEHGTWF